MQDVGRKKKAPLPRWVRLVAGCGALALVVALALFLRNSRRAMPHLDPQRPQTERLFSAEEEDLWELTIDPSDAPAYTLVREGAAYRIRGKEDFPLDESTLQNMLSNVLHITTLSNFGDINSDPVPLDEIGFGENALSVSIRLRDGSGYAFSIGGRVPGSDVPQDYLLPEGGAILYGIDTDMRYALDRKLESLHPVPRLDFSADLMDRFEILGREERLVIERVADSLWEMRQPFAYPVTLSSARQLLSHIKDMRLAGFVSDANADALVRYGLKEPRYVVTMDLAASTISPIDEGGGKTDAIPVEAQQIVLEIGNEIPGLGFYCRYRDGVYQASDLSMGFLLHAAPDHYIGPQALDIPLNLVGELTFLLPDAPLQSYQLELVEHILRSGEFAKDENGQQLYNYHLSYEGESIDPAPLAGLYTSLMALNGFGQVSGAYQPEEHPTLLSLQVRYAGQHTREITFHSYDALHAALAVNGQTFYLVDRASLSPIIDALKDGSLHNTPAQADIP